LTHPGSCGKLELDAANKAARAKGSGEMDERQAVTITRTETMEYVVTYVVVPVTEPGCGDRWEITGSVDSDGGEWFTPNAQTGQDEDAEVDSFAPGETAEAALAYALGE
jgi:hypothetical protein